jgi:hypothetical protein
VHRCVECWTRAEWKALVGAWVVEARPLRTAAGAIAYLAPHHAKTVQGPPPGWRGKRFRPSKGYFNVPVHELRRQAAIELAKVRAAAAGRPVTFRELLPSPRKRYVVELGRDGEQRRQVDAVEGSELTRVRRLLAPSIVPHDEGDVPVVERGVMVNRETGELYDQSGSSDREHAERMTQTRDADELQRLYDLAVVARREYLLRDRRARLGIAECDIPGAIALAVASWRKAAGDWQ